ncbi:hypothetical protein Fleli_3560 [Bernardetia litoralis DSM 6794]|uniref:Uncharacterized protein n=1 Tax=Bernardetia litoralis (strain ATCC 23117 / DSM 6794 / NBRC 15988 / NCIMB 1366 / Fx l1 / Sio-4) TaxID=880071 RepID=I4APJ4_BERLS|nr:hypothetical protein [Bernardetia litoralis]AFM05879.1 hypothetical protein Fleli_3560 [Bernardetia litoralis DSM 6794]
MKNQFYILSLLFVFLSISVFAQKGRGHDIEMSEQLKAMRVAMITQNLNLSSDEAAKFFPIYNEYSTKRENIKKQLKENRKEGKDLTSTKLEASFKQSFELREQELTLDKLYFEKFKTVISVEKIMELYRTERDFRRMLLKELSKRGEHNKSDDEANH